MVTAPRARQSTMHPSCIEAERGRYCIVALFSQNSILLSTLFLAPVIPHMNYGSNFGQVVEFEPAFSIVMVHKFCQCEKHVETMSHLKYDTVITPLSLQYRENILKK